MSRLSTAPALRDPAAPRRALAALATLVLLWPLLVATDGAIAAPFDATGLVQITDALSAIIACRAPKVTIADAAVSPGVVQGVYTSSARDGAEMALPLAGYRHPVLASPTSIRQGN